MPYQTDYVLRLIEQLSGLLRQALEKLGVKEAGEPAGTAGKAIGLALGIDVDLASRLSPQSLRSLLELSNPDREVLELVAQAIELDMETLRGRGQAAALELRRGQATAVRSLLPEVIDQDLHADRD